jgi:hypothetical protein
MSVSFLRIARVASDGCAGVLYRHGFRTGYQDLVFVNHDEAQKFASSVGARYQK